MAYSQRSQDTASLCAQNRTASEMERWFQATGDLDDFLFFYEEEKASSDK